MRAMVRQSHSLTSQSSPFAKPSSAMPVLKCDSFQRSKPGAPCGGANYPSPACAQPLQSIWQPQQQDWSSLLACQSSPSAPGLPGQQNEGLSRCSQQHISFHPGWLVRKSRWLRLACLPGHTIAYTVVAAGLLPAWAFLCPSCLSACCRNIKMLQCASSVAAIESGLFQLHCVISSPVAFWSLAVSCRRVSVLYGAASSCGPEQ